MLNRKIKRVDIVFENCEVYSLTPDKIYFISIDKISRSMTVNECQFTDGQVHDTMSCEKALLILNDKGMNTKDGWLEDTKLVDRVSNYDITAFDFIYTDDTNDYILVPWGNGEYHNELQNNTFFSIDNDELLAIIINDTPLTLGELKDVYGI